MPPKKKTPTPAPAAAQEDPLADIRQEWGGGLPEEDGLADLQADPEAVQVPGVLTDTLEVSVPLSTEEERDEMVAVIIAAWHSDPVSHGFLHRGHRCGCRYIINRALDAVLPVGADDLDETEDAEDVDADGA